jgi:hypothetical protein
MRSLLRRLGKHLMVWPLLIVLAAVLCHTTPAWAGEQHTSVLISEPLRG